MPSGTAASIVLQTHPLPHPIGAMFVQVTGLTGLTGNEVEVGIGKAADNHSNGFFPIDAVYPPDTLIYRVPLPPGTTIPDANNGFIEWWADVLFRTGSTASFIFPTRPVPVPPRFGEFYVELSGVTGFSAADIGSTFVTVEGAADSRYNTTYTIFDVYDPSHIVLFGDAGLAGPPVPPDANNGAISWAAPGAGISPSPGINPEWIPPVSPPFTLPVSPSVGGNFPLVPPAPGPGTLQPAVAATVLPNASSVATPQAPSPTGTLVPVPFVAIRHP